MLVLDAETFRLGLLSIMEAYNLFSKTPPEVRSVGIFGSWDNFANGVAMQHDKLKGKGSWTACPRFDRIICDGVRPNHEKPRSGALKQGGRYWYYVCSTQPAFIMRHNDSCYNAVQTR